MLEMNNWSMSRMAPENPFQAPETCPLVIQFDGGKCIILHRIIGRRGDVLISKSLNEYKLNDPNPDYEAQFPDAKRRILDQFSELGNSPITEGSFEVSPPTYGA